MDKQDIFWSNVLHYFGKIAGIILFIVAAYLYGIHEGFFPNFFGAEIGMRGIMFCVGGAVLCYGGSLVKK